MGTNAIKKTVTHNSQEKEDGMSCKATQGAPGLVRRQREQGENILRAFMVISVGRNG